MKSRESVLVGLVECILMDAFAKCATNLDIRDLKTIRSRVEHEGISFFTITLPTFGQDFERCLANEEIGPTNFQGFRKFGRIPAFLRGIFVHVFDSQTGRILHDAQPVAVESIRQVAYAFKKLSLPCSKARVEKSLADFKQCERDLEELAIDCADRDFVYRVGNVVWGQVLHGSSTFHDGRPKHGPGATCERISGNAKFKHRVWHDRLEPYFPLLESAFSINAFDSSEVEQVSVVLEDDESPVRVITVPKTLKGPRIIAIEPVCMQYTQQHVKSILVSRIERHRFTAGHVNFTDQNVNRSLALTSSRTGRYATLDLSSASDRVRADLAADMFDMVPDLRDAILACRSTRAKLPNGEILSLRKFASMGSALCFPVEAMFFYTLCVAALLKKRNLPVTSRAIELLARDVYIYGDDIIVPVDDVAVVTEFLVAFGCKVNANKSFWTGKFRESCGMDAFDGVEVTPTYVRHLPPSDKRGASAWISLVECSNHFYKRGYWQTAAHIKAMCEDVLGELPIVADTCSGLGWVSFQANRFRPRLRERYNRKYHVQEVCTWVPCSVRRKDELTGYAALQKCLLLLESRPPGEFSESVDHLLSSVRHGAVTLKRRWVRPH